MSDLAGIDILIRPDGATIRRAFGVDAGMLESMPEQCVGGIDAG